MTTIPSNILSHVSAELSRYYSPEVLEAKTLLAIHSFQSLGLNPLDMSYIEEYRQHPETLQPTLHIGWVITAKWEAQNANPRISIID